jgi:hypothetical protein
MFPALTLVSFGLMKRHRGTRFLVNQYSKDERSPHAGLFLDQRTLKDRSRIKTCVIGPPETLSVFLLFLNWQVNQ